MENFNASGNTLFNAETVTSNPRTYTINVYNEVFDSSTQPNVYLSADYTNPNPTDLDSNYIGITYINSNNLTSIELPTEDEQLMAAALKICNNIKRELRNLDDLMLGIIELRSMPLF